MLGEYSVVFHITKCALPSYLTVKYPYCILSCVTTSESNKKKIEIKSITFRFEWSLKTAKNAYTKICRHSRAVRVRSTIYVSGDPVAKKPPKIIARAGQQLQMTCPISGYPIFNINWEKGMKD